MAKTKKNKTASVNSLAEENEKLTIIGWLKKLFTAKITGILVSILGVVVAIIALRYTISDHQIDPMDEALKVHVQKIELFEKQIQDNKAIEACDTIKEVQMINKFMSNCIEYTRLCRSHLSQYKDDTKTKDPKMFRYYLDTVQSQITEDSKAVKKCNSLFIELLDFANQNNEEDYKTINVLGLIDFNDNINKTGDFIINQFDAALKLVNKGNVDEAFICVKNAMYSQEYIEYLDNNLDLLMNYNKVLGRRLYKIKQETENE